MSEAIDLQKLYEAGQLKSGDEFIARNGQSFWFVGKTMKSEKDFPFAFEDKGGIYTYDSSGRGEGSGTNDQWDIVRRA